MQIELTTNILSVSAKHLCTVLPITQAPPIIPIDIRIKTSGCPMRLRKTTVVFNELRVKKGWLFQK